MNAWQVRRATWWTIRTTVIWSIIATVVVMVLFGENDRDVPGGERDQQIIDDYGSRLEHEWQVP